MSLYKGTEFIAGTPNLSDYAKSSEVNSSISSINNTLSSKANTDLSNVSSNIDYVVETYRSDADWYRKYKSGWVEQGGRLNVSGYGKGTITLKKSYSDTNYTVTCAITSTAEPNTYNTAMKVGVSSKTAISYDNGSNGNAFILYWQTYGQGA